MYDKKEALTEDKVLKILECIAEFNQAINSNKKLLAESNTGQAKELVKRSLAMLEADKNIAVESISKVSFKCKANMINGISKDKLYTVSDAIRDSAIFVTVLDDYGVPSEFRLSRFRIVI